MNSKTLSVPFLDEIPAFVIILLVVLGILLLSIVIFFFTPFFHKSNPFHDKKKSEEEIAKEAVDSLVVSPKEVSEGTYHNEKHQKEIAKGEKEYGFIFSDFDIEAMLIQLQQDEVDLHNHLQ